MELLENEFDVIVKQHLDGIDLESENVVTCDWIRIDFSSFSVPSLNMCVEAVKRFSRQFTRMNHPNLNKQTVDLMYAIQLETRSRSLQELYPEIWQPLISANKILEQTNKTLDQIATNNSKHESKVTAIQGWQRNYNKHLEPVFTDIAFEFLKQGAQNHQLMNIFKENTSIERKWTYLPNYDFDLDGLIYDETNNILYMVESKIHLSVEELSKAETTWHKFRLFLQSEKPKIGLRESNTRIFCRQWDNFFSDEYGIVQNRQKTRIEAFLGFHTVDSHAILKDAKKKGFQLIGPDGKNYKVYDEEVTEMNL